MSRKRKSTLELPGSAGTDFRTATMSTSFHLHLSQPMIEFLCATADDVHWDRSLYYQTGSIHRPDNWVATSGALAKRGLIRRKSEEQIAQMSKPGESWEEMCETCHWELTPVGESLVLLFKTAGIFVEADAAISKKSKRA